MDTGNGKIVFSSASGFAVNDLTGYDRKYSLQAWAPC